MKFAPFIIFILFVLRTTGRCGELVIYNSALTDTSKKILYKYRGNEITFPGFDQDKHTAISSLGHTLKGYENYFIYRINNGKSILISIYENDKLIGQQRFEVRILPPIQVRFGNLSDSLVQIEHLLVNPGLFLFYPEEYMIPHQIILRLEGRIEFGDGRVYNLSTNNQYGKKLAPQDLKYIQQMRRDDLLVIEYVHVRTGCIVRRLHTVIRLKIK